MKKIADISHYQGSIDWEKARKELDFAIFRASVGNKTDNKYLENTAECGIPYGAYHYVKAGTADEAKAEAAFFVECANKAAKHPLFYIADIEYDTQTEKTTEAVCVAFLEKLRELGCKKVGLYIGTRYKWAGKSIEMSDIVWTPRWGKNDGNIPSDEYKPKHYCDLWQYTSNGSVDGINGRVDLNVLNGDKPLSYFTEGSEEKTMFTNLQFAAYALEVFKRKWVYWYGTCGYNCTTALFNSKKKQYPDHYTDARKSGYDADIKNGCTCADCVGFIKSFFWKGGDVDGTNKYGTNGCPDTNANGMYKLCKENGKIGTIPDIPGLIVWKSGHIGVYVGGGYTVELMGFAYDCKKKKVTEGSWTNWGKLPSSMLTYVDGDVQPVKTDYKLGERELANGDEGADVVELQTALKKLGYDIGTFGTNKDGIDGDFGSKTKAAVKAFQLKAGLDDTGVFNSATYKALIDAINPEEESASVVELVVKDEPQDAPEGGSEPAYVLIIEGSKEVLKLVQSAYGGTLALVDSVTVADA